jgi:hypothetical protein
MGMACRTHGIEDECVQDFGRKAGKKEATRKTYTQVGMDLREKLWGGMDWIDQAQDRDKWRTLGKTVINLRVP